MLNDIKVGSKLVLLVFLFFVCMGIVAGVGILSLRSVSEETNILYHNNMLALSSAKEANVQLINMSRAVRNMALVTSESRTSYRSRYDGFLAELQKQLKIAEDKLVLPEAKASMQKTKDAVAALLPENFEIMENMNNRSAEETLARLHAVRAKADAADDQMTVLCNVIEGAAQARAAEIEKDAHFALVLSMIVYAIATSLITILGMMIKRAIANPLAELSHKASLVAGGDMKQKFILDRKDELGSLATSLDQMVTHLAVRIAEAEEHSQKASEAMIEANSAKEAAEGGRREILAAAENVELVVSRLSVATEELSAQVEQSSRGTSLQRERVSCSATAMEEMNSTVIEVARNASIAANGSERARMRAGEGQQIVKQSVDSIGTVQKDTEELGRNMEDLGRRAESIGVVMTVIADIADQTNLLALNAAIEAARAGEAGRGFAVVADEVRKLAEKTMNATLEVGESINGIQSGTRQSIGAVERTAQNLDLTSQLVKQSGEALDHIVSESVAVADQIRGIATASEEQTSVSEGITRSLEEINISASEAAIAMQASAEAVSDLTSQARDLQALVCKLRAVN